MDTVELLVAGVGVGILQLSMARKIIGALSSMFLASASCKRSRDFKHVITWLYTAYRFYISILAQPFLLQHSAVCGIQIVKGN